VVGQLTLKNHIIKDFYEVLSENIQMPNSDN
jgi:hypothetical protein